MHLNYIKHFTNIKDNNISFSNVSTQLINGSLATLINATLDYTPSFCPKCGTYHPNLESKGFQKTSLIKLLNSANINTYLLLKKKRFFCHHCNKSFTLSSSIVNNI